MQFSNLIALFGVMLILGAIPSISVLTVSTRSAASGFAHGVLVAFGIVVGDILFILLAIFGLSVLAESMDELFVLIKYLGGAYLIWLGIGLWCSKPKSEVRQDLDDSLLASFLAGLLITLGDQKAILFYLGFLPAFVDLSAMSGVDVVAIIAAAALAIFSTKLVYAYFATKAGSATSGKAAYVVNRIAAIVLALVGVLLLLQAGGLLPAAI